MRASDCGWTAIVELLLEAGASMEAKEHSRVSQLFDSQILSIDVTARERE